MIAAVRGEVLDIALDHVVIEAAGVGYKVMATPSTLATLRRGSEARLITAMIVREDSMTLYGFADSDARDLFLTLLGVSGIWPPRGSRALWPCPSSTAKPPTPPSPRLLSGARPRAMPSALRLPSWSTQQRGSLLRPLRRSNRAGSRGRALALRCNRWVRGRQAVRTMRAALTPSGPRRATIVR